MKQLLLGFCAALLLPPCPASACTICGGDFRNRRTLRQEAAAARVVVYGALSNARLDPATGEGQTDLKVEQVIKGGDLLGGVDRLTLPRYFPGDGGGPPRGLFFFEVRDKKPSLVAARTPCGEQLAAYTKAALALDTSGGQSGLEFFMRRLDHGDVDVAADAFVEVALGADADVARAARAIPAERLRRLLADPDIPRERVGLVAFLLACSGGPRDADLMLERLKQAPEDRQSMRRGLLVGYTVLKPRPGWEMVLGLLADPKRGFLERNAAFGVLVFFHNWKPDENRALILHGMRSAVAAGDLADLAVEELRRWAWWDLTELVVAQYARPSHESAIVRRAILRYALACPLPAAKAFVDGVRKRDPELVADIAESLEGDKAPPK